MAKRKVGIDTSSYEEIEVIKLRGFSIVPGGSLRRVAPMIAENQDGSEAVVIIPSNSGKKISIPPVEGTPNRVEITTK